MQATNLIQLVILTCPVTCNRYLRDENVNLPLPTGEGRGEGVLLYSILHILG